MAFPRRYHTDHLLPSSTIRRPRCDAYCDGIQASMVILVVVSFCSSQAECTQVSTLFKATTSEEKQHNGSYFGRFFAPINFNRSRRRPTQGSGANVRTRELDFFKIFFKKSRNKPVSTAKFQSTCSSRRRFSKVQTRKHNLLFFAKEDDLLTKNCNPITQIYSGHPFRSTAFFGIILICEKTSEFY